MNQPVNTVLLVYFTINLFVGSIVFAWTILTLWLHPDLSVCVCKSACSHIDNTWCQMTENISVVELFPETDEFIIC
jgi:hypothetical protein